MFAAFKARPSARLITFDIDGTLLEAVGADTNKLHKAAFAHAFKELFGIDGTIDAVDHHGSTDPLVAIKALKHYGVPEQDAVSKVPEIKAKMLEYAQNNPQHASDGLSVLPGVREVLKALKEREDVQTGLVTGNLEPIAWMKMEALGLKPLFSEPYFGGFGSDHTDRGHLLRIAAERANELFPAGFGLRVHVGDTPQDIQAAADGGAHAVAVSTGAFSRQDLLQAAKAIAPSEGAAVISSLEDLDAFFTSARLGHVQPQPS